MERLGHLWRHHRLALLAFAVAAVVTAAFAMRTVVVWAYWADPARREPALEPWMTPGYVARAWGVERETVAGALGIALGSAQGRTLEELAAARGMPVAEIEAALMAAILAARAGE